MKRTVLGAILALALSLAAPAHAQIQGPGLDGIPPERLKPYYGATNCVQYVDANRNFSCDPLVVINPTNHTISSIIASTSGGPLVVGTAASFQALGTDLVIAKSATTVAPAGPGLGGVTFRVRNSPRIPGYCTVTAIAGGAFGVEYPLAFLNPNYPFSSPSVGANLFDYITLDLPGGPGGC